MADKSPKLRGTQIEAFRAQIWAFYGHSGRKLPWRNTRNPYKVLVSEVMLQQTQVARVLEKYVEFLRKFPTVISLTNAPLSDVLRVWQGMGYNRRARYLHDTARKIVSEHGGRIPKTQTELVALPGIGPYTARAILAFAYNEPHAFIETNIRRVFIYNFFKNKKNISDKEIFPLIEQTLDKENPREWYYALMDYGSHLPKIVRSNPNKKSKHYLRQKAFEGSLRELRGKIIRELARKSLTFAQLYRICGNDNRTKDTLSALLKEGLIKQHKTRFELA